MYIKIYILGLGELALNLTLKIDKQLGDLRHIASPLWHLFLVSNQVSVFYNR